MGHFGQYFAPNGHFGHFGQSFPDQGGQAENKSQLGIGVLLASTRPSYTLIWSKLDPPEARQKLLVAGVSRKENTQCALYSDPGQRVFNAFFTRFYVILRPFLLTHCVRFLLRSATTTFFFFYRVFLRVFCAFFSFLGGCCRAQHTQNTHKPQTHTQNQQRNEATLTFFSYANILARRRLPACAFFF